MTAFPLWPRRAPQVSDPRPVDRRSIEATTGDSHAPEIPDVCLHPGYRPRPCTQFLRAEARLQAPQRNAWWRRVRVRRRYRVLHVSDAECGDFAGEPGLLASR